MQLQVLLTKLMGAVCVCVCVFLQRRLFLAEAVLPSSAVMDPPDHLYFHQLINQSIDQSVCPLCVCADKLLHVYYNHV